MIDISFRIQIIEYSWTGFKNPVVHKQKDS